MGVAPRPYQSEPRDRELKACWQDDSASIYFRTIIPGTHGRRVPFPVLHIHVRMSLYIATTYDLRWDWEDRSGPHLHLALNEIVGDTAAAELRDQLQHLVQWQCAPVGSRGQLLHAAVQRLDEACHKNMQRSDI